MNYLEILGAALNAVLSQSISFRVGNVTVSATNNGAPVKFTLGAAITAIEEVMAGKAGSFQVGSTLITVTEK